MSKKNGLEILTDEVEIPEIVQMRTGGAFDQIGREPKKYSGRKKSSLVAAMLTAVLMLGIMTTVAVAAFDGSLVEGLRRKFDTSDDQQNKLLTREDMIQIIESESQTGESIFGAAEDVTSVTANGVTVSLTQAVVDPLFVCLAGEAVGLPQEKMTDVLFGKVEMRIMGGEVEKQSGRVMEIREPGTTDFTFSLHPLKDMSRKDSTPGWFLGKQLEITLTDIQMIRDPNVSEERETLVEGQWVLTWTIEGTENFQTYELNQSLGNTEVTVESVTISPMSVEVRYDTPRKTIEYEGKIYDIGKEPPEFSGILLKDGTILLRGPLLDDMVTGYDSETGNEYIFTAKMFHLVDLEEIDSILFKKKHYGGYEYLGHEYVLDDFYVVPLPQ